MSLILSVIDKGVGECQSLLLMLGRGVEDGEDQCNRRGCWCSLGCFSVVAQAQQKDPPPPSHVPSSMQHSRGCLAVASEQGLQASLGAGYTGA